MKSFWISLLVFVLLMCSCKTKKVGSEVYFTTKEEVRVKHIKYQSLADTSNVLKIEIDKSKLKIIETIKITEYDAESGKPIKETEAKRETVQDSNEVVAEEETKGVNIHSEDRLNHSADTCKKVESETKEESVGAQESFGKWLGIVLGIGFLILIVYLCWKLKSRVN